MKLKIKGKINAMIASVIVVLSIIIMVVVYYNVLKMTNSMYARQLSGYGSLMQEMLNDKYTGNWKVEGENLYKGDKLINNDNEFVDIIKQKTGEEVTIFSGDTRVATTIIKNGKRAVNTKASDEVAKKVLKDGKQYNGTVEILGRDYKTRYIPIKDESGNNIGMLFLGIDKGAVNKTIFTTVIYISGILALIIIAAMLVSTIVLNKIVKALNAAVEHMEKLSEGDFTTEISAKHLKLSDEVGILTKSMQNMQVSVKKLIYNIKENFNDIGEESKTLHSISEELAKASGDVSETINQVSYANTEEAHELVDINSNLNIFSGEIDKVVKELEEMDDNAKNIEKMAENAKKELPKVVNSIKWVNDSFGNFSTKMSEFGENINKINSIISLINSISDQTNLLALNASIEASRAGEAGKGFAVVAEEIRKLAEQTKQSSGDIDNLVNLLSKETATIINETSQLNGELNKEAAEMKNSIEGLNNITDEVEEIIPKIISANKAIENIDKKKNIIVDSIEATTATAEEISASSEEIAASSEEMSSSAEEVSKVAANMKEMTVRLTEEINQFRV